jgi:hypothetical protein
MPHILSLADFFGWDDPMVVAAAALEALALGVVLFSIFWVFGRDRWLGDAAFPAGKEGRRPLRAPQTIVPEFTPPELTEFERPLRPAEMGFLLNERTDSTELAATILDLAAPGHIELRKITNIDGESDYRLSENPTTDDDLETYEALLLNWLFGGELAESETDGLGR